VVGRPARRELSGIERARLANHDRTPGVDDGGLQLHGRQRILPGGSLVDPEKRDEASACANSRCGGFRGCQVAVYQELRIKLTRSRVPLSWPRSYAAYLRQFLRFPAAALPSVLTRSRLRQPC